MDVGEFLAELVPATTRSLQTHSEIRYNLELEPGISLGIDRAVPLALVVSELLTNSLKYAFPEKGGTVGVELSSSESDIVVRVFDDGIGYSATQEPAGGTGLGSRIVEALSKQIRAELEYETGKTGTAVKLTLKRD